MRQPGCVGSGPEAWCGPVSRPTTPLGQVSGHMHGTWGPQRLHGAVHMPSSRTALIAAAVDRANLPVPQEGLSMSPSMRQTTRHSLQNIFKLLSLWDCLLPCDRRRQTATDELWDGLIHLDGQERRKLLDSVSAGDIVNLWNVAGMQYKDPLTAKISLIKGLTPQKAEEVITYRGVAVLPGEILLPLVQTFFWEGPVLRSRTELQSNQLGKARSLIWNAYASLQTMLGTTELCDLVLEHATRNRCSCTVGVVERGRLAYGRSLGSGALVLQAYVEQAGKPQCWPPAYVLLVRESCA